MRPLAFWIGTVLLSVGVIVLLIAGGIYAYGLHEDQDYENAVSTATALTALQPTKVATRAPTTVPPTTTPEPTGIAVASTPAGSTGTPVPQATPVSVTPTATLPVQMVTTPGILPNNPQVATRIQIPAINLNAPVAESVLNKGQWVVPRFAAGHLQGTASPGEPGNAVYAGHISSISSGNVFANIGKLVPGDKIVLVTASGDLHYQVVEKTVVKNTDLSVTRDFGDERITLITCTGSWLPLQRDFNERLIIFATRVS